MWTCRWKISPSPLALRAFSLLFREIAVNKYVFKKRCQLVSMLILPSKRAVEGVWVKLLIGMPASLWECWSDCNHSARNPTSCCGAWEISRIWIKDLCHCYPCLREQVGVPGFWVWPGQPNCWSSLESESAVRISKNLFEICISIFYSLFQMAVVAMAGQGQSRSQEPPVQVFRWVAGAQTLGLSSSTFPRPLARSWVRSRGAEMWARSHMGCEWHRWWLNLL